LAYLTCLLIVSTAGFTYLYQEQPLDIIEVLPDSKNESIFGENEEKHMDSPFGIHAPYCIDKTTAYTESDITDFLIDIGAKWVNVLPFEMKVMMERLSHTDINFLI
jgi:hypothetical protein